MENKKRMQVNPAIEKQFNIAAKKQLNGDIAEAEKLYKRLLKKEPSHSQCHNNLAIIYITKGNEPSALKHLKKAVHFDNNNADAYNNLAKILRQKKQLIEAKSYSKKAISIKKNDSNFYHTLAIILHDMKEEKDAKTNYQRAISLGGKTTELYKGYLTTLKNLGEIDEAEALCFSLINQAPLNGDIYLILAELKRYSSEDSTLIAQIEAALNQQHLTQKNRAYICFALGKIHHDLEQYDKAFSAYSLGNKLMHQLASLDKNALQMFNDRIIKTFKNESLQSHTTSNTREISPIFIVGMPRSGTSLIEQILATNDSIFGAGEQHIIGQSFKHFSLSYPFSPSDIDENILEKLRDHITQHYLQISKGTTIVTDKLPANFFHIGAIKAIFPQAKFIHCTRNTLDTCLSCYFRCFDEGNEFSFDLTDTAFYYQKYKELMTFWQILYPDDIYTLSYEKLIHDPASEIQKICVFLGLQWQKEMLNFNKNERVVPTLTPWQRSQNIYSTSTNHSTYYAPYIDELRHALDDVL